MLFLMMIWEKVSPTSRTLLKQWRKSFWHGFKWENKRVISEISFFFQQTPWVINNEAIESIMAEAEQVHHYDNFAKTLRYNLNILLKLEQSYLKCIRDLDDTEDFRVFCVLAATSHLDYRKLRTDFFMYYNAMNGHPNLYFSHLFYDMAKNVESPAALVSYSV